MPYWSDLGLMSSSEVYAHFSFEFQERIREAAPSECLNFFSSLTCTLPLDRLEIGSLVLSYLQLFIYAILFTCNVPFTY